tara:strand:- start:297 stop:1013 length:717 start_codon:yes stop_codon:yes gene_type:complete
LIVNVSSNKYINNIQKNNNISEYLSNGLFLINLKQYICTPKKSKNMWELFQQILQEKMTPNQFLVLYGMKKSLSMPLENVEKEVDKLHKLDMLKENKLTVKGKGVINRFENYFVKAKKKTSIQLMGKEFSKKLNQYRGIFPAGKLPSGKPARVNVRTLENSFRWFFETYDFSWDEIIAATSMYVNEYRDAQYMYMKTSQYYIAKEDKNKVKSSDLADYCDMIRDGVEPEEITFKEKVV